MQPIVAASSPPNITTFRRSSSSLSSKLGATEVGMAYG